MRCLVSEGFAQKAKWKNKEGALECGSLLPLCYGMTSDREVLCNKATAGRRTPKPLPDLQPSIENNVGARALTSNKRRLYSEDIVDSFCSQNVNGFSMGYNSSFI